MHEVQDPPSNPGAADPTASVHLGAVDSGKVPDATGTGPDIGTGQTLDSSVQITDNSPLNVADLASSGYLEVIESDPDGLHFGWSASFMDLALAAQAVGDQRRAKVLAILNAITSMRLAPENQAAPFLPGMTWSDGTHSPLPEEITPEVYDWLALVAPEVPNLALRTRMADLVWLQARRHGVRYAELAIDGYMASSLAPDDWCMSTGAEWRRALQLSKSLGKTGATRMQAIAAQLVAAFRSCAADLSQGSAPFWYADIVYHGRCPGVDGGAMADDLAALAQRHADSGNYWQARDYFEAASRWYERIRNHAQKHAMVANVARQWEAEGDAAGAGAAALHFFQKAVQAWRDLPTAERERLGGAGTDERVRRKVLQAGERTLGQMQSVKGPSIEVDDFIAYAQQRVDCLRPIDALLGFITLAAPPNFALHRQEAIARTSGSISRLFGCTTLAGDGRAVEVRDGGTDVPEDDELLSDMVRAFDHQVQLVAKSMIGPALHAMRQRFSLSLADFQFIAEHSPLVPRDRTDLFAKGLFAGFCLDLVQATHLLQPQFEHLVRMQLKAEGALTSTHENSVDMEIALARLAERPQMIAVFGEDVTFEIRAVMCHQQGANLRNAVAHGLADTAVCESPQALYAWWLILRLVGQSLRNMVGAKVEMTGESVNSESTHDVPIPGQER